MDSELQQLHKTDRNPIQEQRYQQLLSQSGLTPSDVGKGGNGADSSGLNPNGATIQGAQALQIANKAQQMQVQANQPAIATLNTQKSSLDDQYSKLLDSISASEQPALNAQTVATNNELGRRGITSDSGVAQNQMASALLPVTTRFGQLTAQTGLSRQQDLGNIAGQIASLQAGNVGNALNFSSGISSQQEALQQAQLQAANNLAVQKLRNQAPVSLTGGQQLINPSTGGVIAGNTFTPTPLTNTLNNSSSGGQSPTKSSSLPPLSSFVTNSSNTNSSQGNSVGGFTQPYFGPATDSYLRTLK